MLKRNILVGAASALLLAAGAQAALVINVPNATLQPNQANQVVSLFVTGGDAATGFNLRAQIGDNNSSATTPAFTSADYNVGIWLDKLSTVTGGPAGVPIKKYMQSTIVLNTGGDTVTGSGQLVNLVVSTVGITSGTFALKLSGTDINADTVFIGSGGIDLFASITNGSISVPEPSCLGILGLGAATLLARRRLKVVKVRR